MTRGVNFGWKLGGEVYTTKGLNQLEIFANRTLQKTAGRVLMNAGYLGDAFQFTKSVVDGNADPFFWNPFAVLVDLEQDKLDYTSELVLSQELHNAITKGIDGIERLLNSNYIAAQRFEIVYVNDETIDDLLKGKLETVDALNLSISESSGEYENALLIERHDDIGQIIISIFVTTENE